MRITKITRIIDGEAKVFTVYSDANNFSEAFAAKFCPNCGADMRGGNK